MHCTMSAKTDATFLENIAPVPPGEWIKVGPATQEAQRFWTVQLDIDNLPDAAQASRMRSAILDSVARQTTRYDPIGVSLSGGLDSAVTVAAVREVAPEKGLLTFSAGFGADDREIVDAAFVARRFETEHHEIILDPADLHEILPQLSWFLEDPSGREETAFLYITSRVAAKHVSMLMAGYGADHLFAGMPRHRLVDLAFRVAPARTALEDFFDYTQSGAEPSSFLGKALVHLYFKGTALPYTPILGATWKPQRSTLKPSSVSDNPISRYLLENLTDSSMESKTERMHSAFGLSFNAPFMDSHVINRAFRVPDRLKICGRTQKYLLRKAFEGLLPDSVLNRKKTLQKLRHDIGFTRALEQLVAEFVEGNSFESHGLFERSYVQNLLRRTPRQPYSTQRAYRIWSIVMTQIWCRLFLERRGAPLDGLMP